MHTYRVSITEDLNQIPASTSAFTTSAAIPWADPRSPYTNWAQLFSTFNAGEANYRAFELEARHRMQHGLYFDPNYTFANSQADNQVDAPSSFAGEVNYGGPIANRFNIKQDLGNVEGTRRHPMLLTGVYQLPCGRGRSFMGGGGVKDARFESTFTNVLNHTNFAPPATVVDSPSTFGALIGAQTAENAGNRTGQAALRLDF